MFLAWESGDINDHLSELAGVRTGEKLEEDTLLQLS